LAAVQEYFPAYVECDATLLAIAAQRPRALINYVERKGITYPLLADIDRHTIKSYGVYHGLGLTAYKVARPATFIVDKLGVIRYMYIGSNQYDFAEQEEILDHLKLLP